MQGGNTPFLCGTCYTVSKTFLRVFPPPCFRAMSIWFELNMEIFGILYSDYLSDEVSDLIENALALCERRKEQKLTSLCRLQTIQEGLDLYGRRGPWHPTPVLLPGKSHWRRSLVGCSPWGREESGTTERLHFHFSLSCIGEGNGSPLQCSCLENPRDGGAWWAAVYGVSQSRT